MVKAFLDAGLLPRVITGTSAGGLIAALTCTRTDEELKILLAPELANRITACEEPFSLWIQRFWQTGSRFDSVTYVICFPVLCGLRIIPPMRQTDGQERCVFYCCRRIDLSPRLIVCFFHSRIFNFQGSLLEDRPDSQHIRYTCGSAFVCGVV